MYQFADFGLAAPLLHLLVNVKLNLLFFELDGVDADFKVLFVLVDRILEGLHCLLHDALLLSKRLQVKLELEYGLLQFVDSGKLLAVELVNLYYFLLARANFFLNWLFLFF